MKPKLNPISAALAAALALPAYAVDDYGLSEWGMPYSWGETVWQSVHGNAGNQAVSPIYHMEKLVPDYAPDELIRRGLIPGAATVVAFTSFGGRTYYQTGRGLGYSHMHVYDYLTGELVWKTPTWKGDGLPRGESNGPGPGAIGSPAMIGRDNYVYILDGIQLMTDVDKALFGGVLRDSPDIFKYDLDGNLQWVVNVGAVYEDENATPFQLFMDNDGDLVSISSMGDAILVDADTGEIIDHYAVPAERPEPCSQTILTLGALVHATGESWVPLHRTFPCAAGASGMVNPNLIGFDASRNRVAFAGTEPIDSGESGAAWALDIVGEGVDKHFEIAWVNTEIGPNSATSWTLANNQGAGYITDGPGLFYSVNMEDGSVNWTNEAGQTAISPSVDEFGVLVSSTLNGTIVGINPANGDTLYEQSFSEVATDLLPILPPVPGLVDDGTPVGSVGTQFVPSQGASFAQLTFAYGFSALEAELGVLVPIPHLDGELSFDKYTSQPLYENGEPVFSEDIEGADGGHSSTDIGQMVSTHGGIAVGLFCNGLNLLLPEEYKSPNCPVKAGAFVHRPESYCTQASESAGEASSRIESALLSLVTLDDQEAFDATRAALVGMKVLPETLNAAEYFKEINKNKVSGIVSDSEDAAASLQAAADALLKDQPSPADRAQAAARLTQAAISIDSASSQMAKSCKSKGGKNKG